MTTRGLYASRPKVKRPAGSPDPTSGVVAMAMAKLERMLHAGDQLSCDELVRRRNDLGVSVWRGRHAERAGKPCFRAYWLDHRGAWCATDLHAEESSALDLAEWMLDHGAAAPGVTFVARNRGISQLDLLRACGGWSYVRGTYTTLPLYATGSTPDARDWRDGTNIK